VRSECKGVVDVCAWNFEGVMGLGFYVDGGVGWGGSGAICEMGAVVLSLSLPLPRGMRWEGRKIEGAV